MAWTQQANIKGPKGDKGDKGDPGAPGTPGTPGAPGQDGADGAGIAIAGSVATYAALPSGLGPGDAGAGYLVNADGRLYIWSGTAFPANGAGVEFRGPQGPKGDRGDDGADGAPGTPGTPGARGSAWFTGAGTPGAIGGSLPGDMYLDTVSGTVYRLD